MTQPNSGEEKALVNRLQMRAKGGFNGVTPIESDCQGAYDLISQLRAERDGIRADFMRATDDRERMRNERDTAIAESQHWAQSNSSLVTKLAETTAERDRLKEENEKHEGYRVSLRHRYRLAADERDRLAAEVERLTTLLGDANAMADRSAKEVEKRNADKLRLIAELEAAKGEIQELQKPHWTTEKFQEVCNERDALAAKVRGLMEWIETYGDHPAWCMRGQARYGCTCGRTALLSTPPDEGEKETCPKCGGHKLIKDEEHANLRTCWDCGKYFALPPPPNPEGAGDGNGSKRCPKCLSHVAIPNSGEKPLSVTEYAETARDAVRMPDTQGEKEYRMLEEGEMVQPGDQFLNPSGLWRDAWLMAAVVSPRRVGRYRRPITPPTETGGEE